MFEKMTKLRWKTDFTKPSYLFLEVASNSKTLGTIEARFVEGGSIVYLINSGVELEKYKHTLDEAKEYLIKIVTLGL